MNQTQSPSTNEPVASSDATVCCMAEQPALRQWQASAVDQFVAGARRGLKDQLAYVTPGGGKTRFALEVADRLIQCGEVRRLCVVVHTHNLREQWIEAADKFGLILLDEAVRDRDANGFVVTYQQLVDNDVRREVAKVCGGRNQTLVVPDECHHMADGKNWGDNCRQAFGKAWRRILLSGTPVRADDCTIPFVTYTRGVAVADFTYGYRDALRDGVVPPVYFPTFGGRTSWRVGDDEVTTDGSDLNRVDATRRLNTMIGSDEWLKGAIRSADDRLSELRDHHADAGGLIVCKDQRHAKRVADIAQRITGDAETAVSDDSDAHDTIERFRSGNSRWLVTVRMVSEGVDVPRLRVGLYATNYRAELFFRQVVGRFVRTIPGMVDQSAFVYLPDHPDLIGFANDMATDRTHVLRDGLAPVATRHAAVLSSILTPGKATIADGVTLSPTGEFSERELATADQVRKSSGLGYLPLEVVATLLRNHQT